MTTAPSEPLLTKMMKQVPLFLILLCTIIALHFMESLLESVFYLLKITAVLILTVLVVRPATSNQLLQVIRFGRRSRRKYAVATQRLLQELMEYCYSTFLIAYECAKIEQEKAHHESTSGRVGGMGQNAEHVQCTDQPRQGL